jgi:hypothetical protein
MPDHDEIIRAEIDAYRAESRAFREESAARLDAYRAETTAFRAESKAQFERIDAHMERQDRDIATIIAELMRLSERGGENGDE